MPCIPMNLPGGGFAIACTRGRKSNHRLCDGCDRELDPKDSVSPRRELDFCPKCAYPAFSHWLQHEGGGAVYAGNQPHDLKRNAFRFWAQQHSKQFLDLVKRSAASVADLGEQLELEGAP
jgi:predicted amidophosphoribosyltransferase